MKVGDYLICKKEYKIKNSIILVGRKYKIIWLDRTDKVNATTWVRGPNIFGDDLEKLIYINSDRYSHDKTIIDCDGVVIYFSSLRNSVFTELYIDDHFFEVSEFREEKLKELGI